MKFVICFVCLLAAPLRGETISLTPEAMGSVGLFFGGLSTNPVAFIDNVPSIGEVNSAIVEYDASEFAGMTVTAATLTGKIFVNNDIDTGERIIEASVFAGNGVVEASDFQIAAASIGTVSYHPPDEVTVTFAFDLLPEFEALLADGSRYVGVRFAGVNFQAPSQFVSNDPPILTITAVPEPASLFLLTTGSLAMLAFVGPLATKSPNRV